MSKAPQIDFLIVGQGLAGSILAWLLIEQNQKVIICDPGTSNSASRIAAGIVNPITGKRFVKAAAASAYLHHALLIYRQIETFFGQRFFYQKPMLRLFNDSDEHSNCLKRQSDGNYTEYFGKYLESTSQTFGLRNEFGGCVQKRCGYLDCRKFLDTLQTYFSNQGYLKSEAMDYDDIKLTKSGIMWRDTRLRKLIFCEGFQAMHSPWFAWLPFQVSKGEILSLNTAEPLPDAIINRGKWLLPLSPQKFRIGATYEWIKLDTTPSTEAQNSLLHFYQDLFINSSPATVTRHDAGIRPGTLDKQPFIGSHPAKEYASIFNGFGSTGVLKIPYYAERFTRHLLQAAPLPASANINRYYARYTPG